LAVHHAQAELNGKSIFVAIGSNVQSQRRALMKIGRTPTPRSRTSTTIWAGA
jgi:hypothetical protein